MLKEEVLKSIEMISPHAKDYVNNSFENNGVEILYSILTEENMGVFIKVDSDDCCIFYASFLKDNCIDEVLEEIKDKINEYISKPVLKELCFNVYGGNLNIINLVRELGFKSDMEGYHLEYMGKKMPLLNEHNLIDKSFESSMLEEFVKLFDSSYNQLNIDNGWKTDGHATHKEEFLQDLNNLNKSEQIRSFWLNNELVGAYVFEKNYITDIVVKPEHQNKRYGSYILAHCIKNMNENKSINNIRLRVVKSNIDAKRLYERKGFIEIAYFAEHALE